MTTPELSPEAVEAGELLAGLTPLEMDQYAGLTPLERVAAATHPHISMCRLGDTRMDCITCADELHRIRAYLAAVQPVIEVPLRAELADLAQARAVIDATRQMANDANARLRTQLLAALERTDDGRTQLSAYISHLTAQRDALKAALVKADALEQPAPRHAAPDEPEGAQPLPVADGSEAHSLETERG